MTIDPHIAGDYVPVYEATHGTAPDIADLRCSQVPWLAFAPPR
jgi:hypothetical protein